MESSILYINIVTCAVAFIVSIVFTVRPVRLLRNVWLSMATAPLLSVALLLVFGVIGFDNVWKAIKGDDYLRPYTIIILFQSLAYLCLSMNETGVLKAVSLSMVARAGVSYKRLFSYVFILASLLTIFTSNDIVILTMTPIVCHLSKDIELDPEPLLFAQFTAANTLSTIFFFSNPTNIVVSDAYRLTFWSYLQWMFLPTISAGIALFAALFFVYRKQFKIQQEILFLAHNPLAFEMERRDVIPDKKLAAVSITIFAVCLMGIIFAPFIGIDPWLICLICGGLMLTVDVIYDILKTYPELKFQRVGKVCENVPFSVMPFVFGMFILIEALNAIEVTRSISSFLARLCASNGVAFTVFWMLFLSMLFCNLINNQPMTILFVSIIKHDAFQSTLTTLVSATQVQRLIRAAMFAIVMGSNFGANITFIGALAGILWKTILMASFSLEISQRTFFKVGSFCMLCVAICSGLALIAELYLEMPQFS